MAAVVVAVALTLQAVTLLSARRTGTASRFERAPSANVTGPVLDTGSDPPGATSLPPRTVALTFDDGPDPAWTPKVLAVLRAEQVPATFFVVGSRVLDDPGAVRAELRQGDEVGVHTFTHSELASLPAWRRDLELSWTQDALANAAGVHARLLRPPYSSTFDALTVPELAALRDAGRRGYLTVLADTDGQDWSRPGMARILTNAAPAAGRGTVLLLHDGGGNRAQTVAALPQLIDRLRAQGYRFTTVSGALGRPAALDMPAAGRGDRLTGLMLALVMAGSHWLVVGLGALLLPVAALGVLRAVVLLVLARRHARRQRGGPGSGPGGGPAGYLPDVSVVVPAYNEEVGIGATVRSLAASDYPGRLQVVVVDDGSTDATAERTAQVRDELSAAGSPVEVVLVRQINAGKAAALNRGVAETSGQVVVLLDGDTVFEPGTVSALVRPFAEPGVGAVSGNTKVGNRGGLLGRWQHVEYVLGFNLDRRMFDELGCMQTVPGAVGAFRRSVLDAVGGVPLDTLAEDTDLTIAVGRAGWRVAYAEDAVAWTEAPATWRALWSQRYRWCYGTMQAAWKHRGELGRGPVTGPGGGVTHLGRRGLPYLLAFGIAFPLLAPLVDLFGVYGLLVAPPVQIALVWGGFTALQTATAAYALYLDDERLRDAWVVPLQLVAYRQLMYLVAVQSAISAARGHRLPWHKLRRYGTAGATLQHR